MTCPSSQDYAQLLDRWPQPTKEPKVEPTLFTERHLQALWLEQHYFSPLETVNGEKITIISPGIWNTEAGPDFRKAHIFLGDHELHGDIELHLLDDGWKQHGHHEDPRYDHVVLHVSLWPSTRQHPITTSKGIPIAQTYIEPALTLPLKRVLHLIDLDLYPYKNFTGSGRCAEALFRKMPLKGISTLLASAAYQRLEQKSIFLHERMTDKSLRLPAGLAMALGYRKNVEAFLKIFLWLAPKTNASFQELMALGMGVSGFFEAPYICGHWSDSDEYARLHACWLSSKPHTYPTISIETHQTRPLNHPVRRLAFLCLMLRDPQSRQLENRLQELWLKNWQHLNGRQQLTSLRNQLLDLLPHYAHPFWSHHLLFASKFSEKPMALMGRELKTKVLINTLLPLLYSSVVKRNNIVELEAFDNFYCHLKSSSSGKKAYLTHRFFGDTPKGEILKHSVYEQGAMQLHRDFCTHYEASCQGCPFVERVQMRHDSRF